MALMDESALRQWLELALTPKIGARTFQRLLDQGLNPKDILSQSQQSLVALGLPEEAVQHISGLSKNGPTSVVEAMLRWAEGPNSQIVTLGHELYPERLKQISSPPPFLCVQGEAEILSQPQLAIVGSRYPTQAGIQQTLDFAEALTDHGWIITSGLAKGVDGHAHRGCLQAGGKTVAVLGSGLQKMYPKQHARLAEEIANQGALVSELPLSMPAHAHQFPQRNRIVSGLSYGVLVIEAGLKSGSLITARQALEQNREIFAVPGSIQNPQKEGCHYLIQQGANLVQSANEITALLQPMLKLERRSSTHSAASERVTAEHLDPEEYRVMNRLDYEGMTVDQIALLTSHPVYQVTSILMTLELNGLIRQDQGLYMRV